MTIDSGFFNSVNHDRRHDASVFNQLFEGILRDGVLSSVGDSLIVIEDTGMDVVVGSGRAWFHNLWLDNSADYALSIPAAHISLPRIDTVVLDFDETIEVRKNDIIVLEGTPSSSPVPPTLISSDDHNQYPLAYILVEAGVSAINTGDITIMVGTDECPLATGILEQLSATVILARWDAEYREWLATVEDNLNDECIAASLQSQIDGLRPQPVAGRNMIINGDMGVRQRGEGVNELYFFDAGSGLYPIRGYLEHTPSMWYTYVDHDYESISLTPHYYITTKTLAHEGLNKQWMSIERRTTQTGSQPASDKVYVEQTIEANSLYNWRKGGVDAEPLYLSFLAMSTDIGNYMVEVIDRVNGRHVSLPYVITASMVENRFTIVVPADTSGVVPLSTDAGVTVRFWLRAGSDYNSGVDPEPGVWGAVVDNHRALGQYSFGEAPGEFLITDVQLESDGPSAFERLRPAAVLDQCQRFYEYIDRIVYSDVVTVINDQYQVEYPGSNYAMVTSGPFTTPKRSLDETSLEISSGYMDILTDYINDVWVARTPFAGLPGNKMVGPGGVHFRYEPIDQRVNGESDMIHIHAAFTCEFPGTLT